MPIIKRTLQAPGEEDQVETFHLPFLSSRIVGPGVNNKVIYDLKKRGRSEVEYPDGRKMIFEVTGNNAKS